MNPLGVYHPAAPPQFSSDSRPAIARHLERDSLDRVAQFHVAFGRLGLRIETVEASPAYTCQSTHVFNWQLGAAHFLPDLHPLFFDALQAPFQKVDLQCLLSYFPLQPCYP